MFFEWSFPIPHKNIFKQAEAAATRFQSVEALRGYPFAPCVKGTGLG